MDILWILLFIFLTLTFYSSITFMLLLISPQTLSLLLLRPIHVAEAAT